MTYIRDVVVVVWGYTINSHTIKHYSFLYALHSVSLMQIYFLLCGILMKTDHLGHQTLM